ncbi:MAG TPA: site-specific DNA-methyltransferase [Bryobacteraceae bacterium]|nr:site-specific DNA-methyltransferase [Bryobacteraceae bacterium]
MARTKKSGNATAAQSAPAPARTYTHSQTAPLRPDIGTQPQFRQKRQPKTYKYDSSLSPALDYDGQNQARERGEKLIRDILEAQTLDEARAAAAELRQLSRPFLDWAGKAERFSFEVPTVPLFVHERLSTKAILETLSGHKREDPRDNQMALFGDPQRPIVDQILKPYEHGPWQNRMILGDSLVVMNSLLEYEGLGGKVQMIYMDPPYGVKFGSNFQPFVRKRDVSHGDDEDMTREPEMVQAYRDTWEVGLHSYLTYLRDRLKVARDLLTETGSVFVQISDENVHHVREVMDDVFGRDCFVVTIVVKKKGSQKSSMLDPVNDYILWYGRSPRSLGGIRFRALFSSREIDADTLAEFKYIELPDGRQMNVASGVTPNGDLFDYRLSPRRLFVDYPDARLFRPWPITNGGIRPNQMDEIRFNGKSFNPPTGRCWSYRSRSDSDEPSPMEVLKREGRLHASGASLDGKRYLDDFPFKTVSNWWDALGGAASPLYVVQSNDELIQRCLLMTTDPGDLVLDPTCGSGTTAYVAEQWGRRWITVDVSRVPLALARQRLLTATFPWYELKDESRGPAGGFVYKRRQNSKGEEVGGIVPHITLKSIANNEPPQEEVLVDRPETVSAITRVTGPFCFESTMPTALGIENEVAEAPQSTDHPARMLEVLRHSPVLRLPHNQTLTLKSIKAPGKTLVLNAEAIATNGSDRPVAFVFGPEDGPVTERLVWEAAREAHAKNYTQLFVVGFAIEANARRLVENCEAVIGIPAAYVQASTDLTMGDLLKNMRSSHIFSVCGLPDIDLRKADDDLYEVELRGLDTFNPVDMEAEPVAASDVPAWFLDTDYNDLCFHVCQAFFPRTGAWDNLKRALRATHEETVWDHLSGTVSAPFDGGNHKQIAVKVMDVRGNELLVVKKLSEATRQSRDRKGAE